MAHLAQILERSAQRRPEVEALIGEDVTLTYDEFNKAANRLARVLQDRGLSKGDRLVLNSINSPYFLVAAYAALKLGAVLSPVNPQSRPKEISYFLKDSGASIFIAHPAVAEPSAEAFDLLDGAPAPTALSLGEAEGFEDALALSADKDDTNLDIEVSEDDNALILYTSGTTGDPKGAVLTHHAVIWAGIAIGMGGGLHERERVLLVAPMYHSAPLTNTMFPTILAAGTLVIRSTFDPRDALKTIEKFKCTFTFVVPTMVALMLRVPDLDEIDVSSMKRIFYGAAPMPGSLVTRAIDYFTNARLIQGTGLTEGGPGGAILIHEEILERPWASGRAASPNGAYRIVDPDGNDVAEGEVGEMIIQSESMMKEYWNKPEATAETIRDGWLHTGDLAKRESDGYMTLVDRMKDMIISGGKNIYSAEVENAVSGHPGVLDVAVVGDTHEVFGETVVAVVVPTDPENPPSLESIREHAEKTLSHFKLPRKVLYREIPRNPSGKILKHRLRDEVRAELKAARENAE